jgi:hypothetical protein
MSGVAFEAIPLSSLGDKRSVEIDTALIPYLLGVIDQLTVESIWNGTGEDIETTVKAFELLMKDLMLL